MERKGFFPPHGYVGILLVGVGWPLAWLRPESLELLWENSFLLLWLGYILVTDALNYLFSGSSLLTRNPRAFSGMFVISIPLWWLFEFLNLFLSNWHYVTNRPTGDMEYAIRASIHFSVVIPAVFSTAELWSRTPCGLALKKGRPISVGERGSVYVIVAGIVMLVGVVTQPRWCFPLTWVCLYCICDGLNRVLAIPSLLAAFEKGNWRTAVMMGLGAFTCGIFWEMWNYYALPKWMYTVPFVDFAHVFEMPLLGYLGYFPFGLELYASYFLILELSGLGRTSLNGGKDYFFV